MCGAHAAVRSLVAEMVGGNDRPTVVDIEAGLEHLSRGTASGVDTLLVIVEPYFKSMETAARVSELGHELGIGKVFGVANKVSSSDEERDLRAFCGARGLGILGVVPQDELVRTAERRGVGPLDIAASGPAIESIGKLAQALAS